MNSYIEAQCRHMIAMADTFTNACHLAAKKDDEKVSREEEHILKQINTVTDKYKKAINKILQK